MKKILIVEDELIIATDLGDILESLGYEVCGDAISAREALELINEQSPDLVLLDIQIKGGMDGIELAGIIRSEFRIPFIFLTSHADASTLQRAKEVKPYGYIVKPFQEKNIRAAIEIALGNFEAEQKVEDSDSKTGFVLNDSLFVRSGGKLVKLRYEDILYFEADGNYTNIYTHGNKFVIRSTLKDLELLLSSEKFARVHRSYLIQLNAIEAIDSEYIQIAQKEIPLSRSMYSWLIERIKKI